MLNMFLQCEFKHFAGKKIYLEEDERFQKHHNLKIDQCHCQKQLQTDNKTNSNKKVIIINY